MQSPGDISDGPTFSANGHAQSLLPNAPRRALKPAAAHAPGPAEAGYVQLVACVAGIYISL